MGLLFVGAWGIALHVPLEGCFSAPLPDTFDPGLDAGVSPTDGGPTTMPPPVSDAVAPVVDASSCEPGDVSKFKPSWKPPTPLHQGLCTLPQIAAFKTACIGGTATTKACAPFNVAGSVEQKCAACIKSQEADAKYGPLVERKGFVELNLAGCIANIQRDPQGGGCAGSYQASLQCVAAACSSNCPVLNDMSFNEYQSCSSQATQGGCKAYSENAKCVDQLAEAGADGPTQCLSGATFSDRYDLIVPLFCAGPTDAGADG